MKKHTSHTDMTDTLIFTDSDSSPVTKTIFYLANINVKKERKLNNIKIASANLEIDFY